MPVVLSSQSFAAELAADGALGETPLEFRYGLSYLHELKYPAGFAHFDYINPDAPKGGTIVLPVYPPSWSNYPLFPRGWELLYDPLLEQSGDEIAGFYGRLAESLAVAPDRRSLAFRLRPEARWHDGVPITTADVKFTFDMLKGDPWNTGWRQGLHWVSSIEIVNEREFVIHTRTNALGELFLLSYLRIMPAHFWADKDMSDYTGAPPLGSGPYRLAEVQDRRFFRYERVPDYWGRDLAVNRGRFNFDVIHYDFYSDATIAREALRKGLFDVWMEFDLRYWQSYTDHPAHQRGWLRQEMLGDGRGGTYWRLVFNTRRAPFDDRRVREALTHVFDFEWQNRTLYGGEVIRADSYFANTIFAAVGVPSSAEVALLTPFRDELPQEVFTEAFTFPRTGGVGHNRKGLLKARSLLENAGWRVQDGVLVNAEGEPFTIEFLVERRDHQRILLPYTADLSTLGISATVRLIDFAVALTYLRELDYDAIIRHGIIWSLPPTERVSGFHSRYARSGDAAAVNQNLSGMNHPAIDALVDATLTATSLDEMVNASRALDRVVLWNYYQILLEAVTGTRLVYWDKFGRPPEPVQIMDWHQDRWWFNSKKAARIATTVQ